MRALSIALVVVAGCSPAVSPNGDDPGRAPSASPSPQQVPLPQPGASPLDPPSGRRLGAIVDGDGVIFRVWAPGATAAWVDGEVSKSAMHAEDDLWVTRIAGAHAGQGYRFVFQRADGTTVDRVDPYCRELRSGVCFVVDPAAYAWKSASFTRPARNVTIVYEMHVGSLVVPTGATNGTFATARTALPRLADLGVNVVEMMPVQDFGGGNASWGYNPQLFLAPKESYGSSNDLRAFVDDAHARGIGAWIDVVYNHTDGYKNAPLRCFDGSCGDAAGVYFFPKGPYASTPWGPRLDYTKREVSDMVLDSVHAWLTEYRGDGFRWDSVSNIRALDGQGETPGGKSLIVRANDWTHKLGGSSVAEDLKGYDAITKKTSDGGFGFDAQWDGFGYVVNDLLVPFADDGRDLGKLEGVLRGNYAGDAFARLLWIENHDSVGNGGARLPQKIDPANPESFAARKRSMLAASLLMTTPGVPMLFMGQEDLVSQGFGDPAPAMPAAPTAAGQQMHAFYKDLIALRRSLAGLSDPAVEILHRNDTAKIIAYRRGKDVVVVLNLRNQAYTRYDIGVPSAGPWTVRLDADATKYGDDFTGGQSGSIAATAATKDTQPFTLPLALGPYGTVVLTR
jgi:1,4-alpha-glucan branching enzyme